MVSNELNIEEQSVTHQPNHTQTNHFSLVYIHVTLLRVQTS